VTAAHDTSPPPGTRTPRVAVVTGASSGLGDRFARVLHGDGASVVISARRADRLAALREELGPERVLAVPCDLSDESARADLIDITVEHFGRVDILVNNAGLSHPGPAEHETLEEWDAVLQVNLTALFSLCQHTGRVMLAQGSGSIVNVASILGLVAAAPFAQASYAASKGAVVNLTRELACQWARRGVRVNAIAPGWFLSEMTREGVFEDERSLDYVRRNCPMGRTGEPHELDGLLLLLAGEGSSYITGQTIAADGGWTAH
jgi:NAD(P)-dependent dehydrogenase (short-subunit alcohol dehydrogenase family)